MEFPLLITFQIRSTNSGEKAIYVTKSVMSHDQQYVNVLLTETWKICLPREHKERRSLHNYFNNSTL